MIKVDDALLDVKKELYSEPIIKEYFRLLDLIKNDENLTKLDTDMRKHQKAMCENMDNDEVYKKEKEAYEACLNQINSNPLYLNFLNVKEEVFNLLNEVKDTLQ